MKPGSRLFSQTDDTEVIVVRPDDTVDTLHCGGHPMVDHEAATSDRLPPAADSTDGNQLGKRYTLAGTDLEILVTKAGIGTLASGAGNALVTKEARPLPASD